MALGNIQVGAPYDFNRLQALNLVFHSATSGSAPATPVEGQPWYQTDTDVLKLYTGSVWSTLVLGPTASTAGRVPSWNGTSGGALNDGYDIVTTVGGTGVDTALPTEQAVREAIADALSSEVSFKGGYNASTNTPDLDVTPIATAAGDMYFVSTGGTFFTEVLEAGDVIIANQINATALAHWTVIQKNLSSPVTVAQGGTGLATLTQYGVMIGAGTGNVQFVAAVATANLHLKNVSASANPVWSTSSYAEASAAGRILRASGANVWAESTISIVDAFASGGIPHASTANTLTNLAISATAGVLLRSTGTLPAWGAVAYPNSAVVGDIPYASTTTNIAMLTSVTVGSYLRSGGVGTVPVWSTLKLANSLVQWGMLYAATADNLTTAIAAATVTGTFLRGTAAGAPAWSTLVLPNTIAVGALLQGSASNTAAVLASVTAGSFLRSGGVTTASAWSTVKLPDTMSALGIWVANAVNTVVNLTVTANQSIRMNSGGTAWEAFTPSAGGTTPHNFLDSTVHSDTVTNSPTRGNMIVGNAAGTAWTALGITTSGASGYVLASNATDAAWKKQRYVEKLSTSATSYDIVHNLGTRRVMVLCQDTTNNQNILVDWNCKSAAENTTITVYFGTAPTANTRIITVFGINFENALDTAN